MAAESSGDEFTEENIPPPKGTVFLLGLYLLALAAGWAAMFLMLVDR
jgi:hypothetical protein